MTLDAMNNALPTLALLVAGSVALINARPLPAQDTTATVATPAATNESAERALIASVLTDYIEGSTNGQPSRLRSAFHPDLNLYYVGDGVVKTWSGVDYIASTKEGEPTGERGTILSIDFENDIAVAKVEIAGPESDVPYIDYFMLLKAESGWSIVHKAFTKKQGPSAEALRAADEAAIRQQNKNFSEACVAGDMERQVALYTADAVLAPPRRDFISGAQGVRDYRTPVEGRELLAHRISPVKIEVRGNLAYDWGIYDGTEESNGETRDFRGKYLVVWRREPDGVWRMAQDMWNDLPPSSER